MEAERGQISIKISHVSEMSELSFWSRKGAQLYPVHVWKVAATSLCQRATGWGRHALGRKRHITEHFSLPRAEYLVSLGLDKPELWIWFECHTLKGNKLFPCMSSKQEEPKQNIETQSKLCLVPFYWYRKEIKVSRTALLTSCGTSLHITNVEMWLLGYYVATGVESLTTTVSKARY